jgi:hypothetical protein
MEFIKTHCLNREVDGTGTVPYLLFGLLLGLLIVHVYIKIADCINININRYVSPMIVWAYGHIGVCLFHAVSENLNLKQE